MSKYIDIIRLADSCRPNALEDQVKLWWLVNLDGKIAIDLMRMDSTSVQEMMDCGFPEGLQHEPLVGFPREEMYLHYLEAKILYAQGEYSDYQNAMEAFNAAYNEFAAWFLNRYDPAQGYSGEEESG